MPIQVECGGCRKAYTVPDEFAGKRAKCKRCGRVLIVPFEAEVVETVPDLDFPEDTAGGGSRLGDLGNLARAASADEQAFPAAHPSAGGSSPMAPGPAGRVPPKRRPRHDDPFQGHRADVRPNRPRRSVPPWVWIAGGSGATILVMILVMVLMSGDDRPDEIAGAGPTAPPAGAGANASPELPQTPNAGRTADAASEPIGSQPSRAEPSEMQPSGEGSSSPTATTPPAEAIPVTSGGDPAATSGLSEPPPTDPTPASPSRNPPPAAAKPAPAGATPASDEFAVDRAPTEVALRYRWQTGQQYVYEFTIEADTGGQAERTTGTAIYTVRDEGPAEADALPDEEQKGTGTAFVVAADGHLLTCAHVVESASNIEVQLGGKTYTARPIALDPDHDLALIRIDARNLPVLPLADSDAVELAQEVRVVGYPLSSVLGSSIKITRGTVAGFVEPEGEGRLLQLDASINPGNSGGPVVNEQGQVVGVASAKLAGEAISNVGFAVPGNEARPMLTARRVAPAKGSGGPRLEGPELARRVAPAVAFVSVTIGPKAAADVPCATLSVSSHWTTTKSSSRRPGPGSMPGFSMPQSESGRGELVADAFGEVYQSEVTGQLPYVLGSPCLVAIEPLSPTGRDSWVKQNAVTLIVGGDDAAGDPFGPGGFPSFRPGFGPHFGPSYRPGRPGFGPSRPSIPRPTRPTRPQESHPAMEQTSYHVRSRSAEQVVLDKRFELRALSSKDSGPKLEIRGQGTLTFDLERGVPLATEMKYVLSGRDGEEELRLPVKFSHKLIPAEEWERRMAEARKRTEESRKRMAEEQEERERPLTDKEAAQLARDLKSGDLGKQLQALNLLRGKSPDEPNRAVAAALEALLKADRGGLGTSAAMALEKWATPESVDALTEALGHQSSLVQRSAMAALARLKPEGLADKIAPLLANLSMRRDAAKTLKAIGSDAEPAVLAQIEESGDMWARREICDVLKVIGTEKSIPALEKLVLNDPDTFVQSSAREALDAVRARK